MTKLIGKMMYIVVFFVLLGGIFMPSYAQTDADTYRAELLTAVNLARQQNNVPTLTLNDKLSLVAQTSIESVALANSYDVVSIESIDELLDTHNYSAGVFWYAMHYNRQPQEAVNEWISFYAGEFLSDIYSEIGIGYAENRFNDRYIMIVLSKPGESVLPTTMPPACENPIVPYPIKGQDLIPPQSPERIAQIRVLTDLYDSLAQGWLNDALVPGAVIGLIDNGEFIWAKAYGYSDARTYTPMTTDMIFGVASLSKPIASLATMQLYEQGLITLDMPVFETVTTWQPVTDYNIMEITPYRLMSHTAGFPTANSPIFKENFSPAPTLLDTLNGLGRRGVAVTLNNQPGDSFAYSNAGYSVLQLFIETVTGDSFADYTRCNIFEPLGMMMTDFYLRPDIQENHAVGHDELGNPMPEFQIMADLAAAGLQTSVSDFARWVVALLANPSTPNVLSAENIALMMTPAEATDGQYGLGFYLTNWQGEIIPNHTGSTPGFRSYFQLLPDQRHAIIVLSNSDNGEIFNNRVVGQWLQWLKSLGEIEGSTAEELEIERQTNITRLIQLINDERAKNQLAPLLTNEYVMRDAQLNSQTMASSDDVEGHDLGGFANRMSTLNYDFDYFYYWSVYGTALNAQAAFNIWYEDEETFSQLFLDETFDEIGIGLSTSGSGVNYYAVLVVRR